MEVISDVLLSYFCFDKPLSRNILHTFWKEKPVDPVIQDHQIREKVQQKHPKTINTSEDVKENHKVQEVEKFVPNILIINLHQGV